MSEGPFVHTFTLSTGFEERWQVLMDAAFEVWLGDPTNLDFEEWAEDAGFRFGLAELDFGIVHQRIERWVKA